MQVPGVERYFVIGGQDNSTGTQGSNVATIIAQFKPWDDRKSDDEQIGGESCKNAQKRYADGAGSFHVSIRVATHPGAGTTGGFQFVLEDRAGGDMQALAQASEALLAAARAAAGTAEHDQ